jgi:hypothetical protein
MGCSTKLALMAGYSECVNELADALAKMKVCAINDLTELGKAAKTVSDLWQTYDQAVADLEEHVREHGC